MFLSCNIQVKASDITSTQRTLSGSQDVSVVIGLQSCPTSPCAAPDSIMGDILFVGPYTPDPNGSPPSQTFTVNIPAGMQKGRAQLGVVHFALIGVSYHSSSMVQTKITNHALGRFGPIPSNFEYHTQHRLIQG
jgi:hypothetical protein